MREAFALQKLLTIFQQKYWHISHINSGNFNEMFVVSFEQPSPFVHHQVTSEGFWVCLRAILFYPITLEGCRGTTDECTTIPFHLVLFSAALV